MLDKLKNKYIYKLLGLNDGYSDIEEESEWLADMWDSPGFKSYTGARYTTIVKEILLAIDAKDFQKVLVLNGRRQEILKLKAFAKKAFNIRELDEKNKNHD